MVGTYKHGGRRGMRDDGISVGEGKPLRRGGPSSYGAHEVCFLYTIFHILFMQMYSPFMC